MRLKETGNDEKQSKNLQFQKDDTTIFSEEQKTKTISAGPDKNF